MCVIVYLDDILIYSDDPLQHHEHVCEVLRRLRKHKLYCNPSKCEFSRDTVEYLGFILSPKGLTMSSDKVKAILEWPTPRKVKDIQSFLGFANFYRRFIHNYSDIVVPMTRLTRKGAPWNWSASCQEAFDTLKIAFTTVPILFHWEPNLPLIVETDASDYAERLQILDYSEMGGTLLKHTTTTNSLDRVVAFNGSLLGVRGLKTPTELYCKIQVGFMISLVR